MDLKAKIEAVLFLSAKPIKAQAMARIVNADVQIVRQALLELVHDYEERKGGLEISDYDGYCFQVKDEYASLMDEFLPVEMSAALIRTLSSIAIKQPVTQSDIIRIRGAGAYEHIKELANRELVAKKEGDGGRSPILSTTKKFQEYFRLTKDGRQLRDFLKDQMKRQAAGEPPPDGQLVISQVVPISSEAEIQLNNRIFLETADMAEAVSDAAGMLETVPPKGEDESTGGTTASEAAEAPALDAASEEVSAETAEAVTEAASEEAAEEAVREVAEEATQKIAEEAAEATIAVPGEEIDLSPPAEVNTKAKAKAKSKSKGKPKIESEASDTSNSAAASTLSKLAAVAEEAKEPEAVPEVELAEAADEQQAPPQTTTTNKSSVQAHNAKGGPATGNVKKGQPSGLAGLLRKQRELEQALRRAKDTDVQQATIDFGVKKPPDATPDKSIPPS